MRSARGAATTEVVLVMPAVLFLMMLIIQFALWYHAQNVAITAAQDGARVARLADATADEGAQRARQVLRDAAGKLIEHPTVTAERDANTARVTVGGTVVAVIPGLHLSVDADAASPVERFRAGTSR